MSDTRRQAAPHMSWADDDDEEGGPTFDDLNAKGKGQDDASSLAKDLSVLSTGENSNRPSNPPGQDSHRDSPSHPTESYSNEAASAPVPTSAPEQAPEKKEDNMSNGGWGDNADEGKEEKTNDTWGQPASGNSNGGGGGGGDNGWGAPLGDDSGFGGGGGYGGGDGGYGDGGGGGRRDRNEDYQAALGEEVDESGLILNDYKVEVKLADMQEDPNSPLYSIKRFEELNLHPDLQKGIYGVGFKKPSKIQEVALPLLLNNPPRNLIGQSQSGTGKTAAFALNMLSRVSQDICTPQAICLAPSRELAVQIQKVINDLCKFTAVKTFLAVPRSWDRRKAIEAHILIGTPGTIVDMLSRGTDIFDPEMIRMLVLDEADEMVAIQGQGDQTTRIKRMLPPGTQNVLFSATFTDEVREFAQEFAPEANQIFLAKEEVTVDSITQLYMLCDGEEAKFDALSALYDVMTIGQSIVFCKKRDTSDEVAERLTALGHSVASLHGLKDSGDRDRILDGFRNGKTKVLITTNVVARGIDIQQVNMVVNYDVPNLGPEGGFQPDVETYIHRIGRTGRFGRKGCAVTFAHDSRSKGEIDSIMEATGRPMKRIDAGRATDIDVLEKVLKQALKGTA